VDRKSSTDFSLSQVELDIEMWSNECRFFSFHRAPCKWECGDAGLEAGQTTCKGQGVPEFWWR
jgi:hypothetical protein